MKNIRTIMILAAVAAMTLSGCAMNKHSVTTTDPAGNKTTTTDKSSQSDNGAMNAVSQGFKFLGDVVAVVVPPIIPVIVSGLTHPVTTPPANVAGN